MVSNKDSYENFSISRDHEVKLLKISSHIINPYDPYGKVKCFDFHLKSLEKDYYSLTRYYNLNWVEKSNII